jgi:hypothetical protein
MKRLGFLCAALIGTTAFSAEITRVASSFEEKDPFGMFLDFTFDRTADRATNFREWYQRGELQDVTELRYQKYETKLGIDLNLGIYKDLEIHVGAPIIFQQDRNWFFAGGTNEGNTTISRNCSLDPAGAQCTQPGMGNGQLFDLPPYPGGLNSYRSGLGDFTFGIAWNALVQAKDSSKPTWTLRFDYTAPTSALLNPTVYTSNANRGNVGDKIHRYTFSTAVSKHLNKYFEPYVEVHYTLPWRGPGFYSNCDDASSQRQGHPENCGGKGWSREQTGVQPAHTGGAIFGMEITVFEREDRHQRVSFDLRGFLNYVSEGRYYNELSDLFGKLLYSSDYGQAGAQFGFVGQAAEFIKLKASTSFAYNTEHFLTNENIGKDLTGNGVVDVTGAPQEISPNYDFRIDPVGRRFRIEQQYIFRVQVTASFNF